MKKIFTTLFAILLIASLSVTAFADTGIVNVIAGMNDTQPAAAGRESGMELIRQTGDQDEIVKPNYRSYFDVPQVRYIDAPKNHSVYVYKGLDTDIDKPEATEYLMPFAYEGLKVLEVAREQGMSCIIYRDSKFVQHAGWVETRYLTDEFPGAEVTVGRNGIPGIPCEAPALTWSRDRFVGSVEKYAVLEEAAANCVQIKLAYQVTDTDGARFEDMLGMRTVYVNDGNGWVQAGQFEYDEQGTVLVIVNLSEATRVEAIAVIASCNEPGHVVSRVEIQELSVQQ